MTEAFAALAAELPTVMAPLIHERDMFLTYQIKNSCALLSQLIHLTGRRLRTQLRVACMSQPTSYGLYTRISPCVHM